MAAASLRVGMVAGEASGDLLGAHLMTALRARGRPMDFAGIGGPRMVSQGFVSHYPMEKLSVRGYTEALLHFREILGIRSGLTRGLLAERPDLFIGVDASEFNLGLERSLKDAGIPTIHYVSPSVWAWRGWRVRRIARSVNHILVMFRSRRRSTKKWACPSLTSAIRSPTSFPSTPTGTRRARSCACLRAS